MSGIRPEHHRGHRTGWLRAAVLGANDGVVSVASLVVGVAAGGAAPGTIMLTGTAGLIAGALSMAAGEYISVQSQADTEGADINLERRQLTRNPAHELDELTSIYVERGLSKPLARQVAEALTQHGDLEAHVRDELGITEMQKARPVQAAMASAAAFAVGAIIPIGASLVAPVKLVSEVTGGATVVTLWILGSLAAYAGGAPVLRGAIRVTFWGVLAMAITAGVGKLLGAHL